MNNKRKDIIRKLEMIEQGTVQDVGQFDLQLLASDCLSELRKPSSAWVGTQCIPDVKPEIALEHKPGWDDGLYWQRCRIELETS